MAAGHSTTTLIFMRHTCCCIALFSLLLVGCPQTEPPPHSDPPLDANLNLAEPAVVEPAVVAPAVVAPAAAEPAVVEPATVEPAAVEPAAVEPAIVEPVPAEAGAAENWISLFDGESTAGWSMPVYGGDGEIDVRDGNLVIGRGEMMTGIRYEKEFPTVNYEIRYEARRTNGYDFFAACTFPVKESFCTFVNGGWGGGLTGLSSLNGFDASENETGTYFEYRDNVWHRFRIRVTEEMIQVWITAQDRERNWGEEESVIELEIGENEVGTRYEVERYKPLGFTTWNTEGQLRNIEYRMIE